MTFLFINARRSYLLYCMLCKVLLSWREGLHIKKGVRFLGVPIISTIKGSRVEIGERVVLCGNSHFADLGVSRGMILRTSRPGARIVIGDDSGLTGAVICAAQLVSIGRDCLFGANVTVADNDFHPLAEAGRRYERSPDKIVAKPVIIGNNVFVGTETVILKGVTIGDNSVIGAGSVVVNDIPANCIAAGNPAKVIRTLEAAPAPSIRVAPPLEIVPEFPREVRSA